MRKKLLTGIMTAVMVMCLGVTPVFAGNTNFNTGTVTNYSGSYTYREMSNYPNTKATTNADWFINISSLSFSGSTANTLGIMFTPMVRTGSNTYKAVGAAVAWTRTTMGTKYYSWNGHGTANVTYYLGVRLDTLLNTTIASASGYWNAN